jgi:hypothetical protein
MKELTASINRSIPLNNIKIMMTKQIAMDLVEDDL